MKNDDAQECSNNVSLVQATADGEVEVGFVNHYYLGRFLEEHGEGFQARNYYIGNGDPGALVLVAGAGILEASENKETAQEFFEYLLSKPAQVYSPRMPRNTRWLPGWCLKSAYLHWSPWIPLKLTSST